MLGVCTGVGAFTSPGMGVFAVLRVPGMGVRGMPGTFTMPSLLPVLGVFTLGGPFQSASLSLTTMPA
eukprot:11870033-Alexandrium_andersonii.AAC.1